MARIMLCVLHFRLGARYVEANPPFTSIEMDYSDSAREGCAVSTLTILSEPCDWRGAVQVPPTGSDHDKVHVEHVEHPVWGNCESVHLGIGTAAMPPTQDLWRVQQVAVQEVRRLQQFGVTNSEMERYKAALLRDSNQMASQADSIASADNLNFVMEYLALGHTIMHAKQARAIRLMSWLSVRWTVEVLATCCSACSWSCTSPDFGPQAVTHHRR